MTYQYDNSGALATVEDSATGRKTTYYYDFTDRLMKYVETGSNYYHSVGYEYDQLNNLTSLVETINGTDYTTSYVYDDDNRVTSVTTNGTTVEYTYDAYGRISQQVTKRGDTTILTETYTYVGTDATTSGQIATYKTETANYSVTYTYTYDDNGNILSFSDGTRTTTYVYDSANQLIRENNQRRNKTYLWTYDDAGNILSQTGYTYTTGTITESTATVVENSYTYGDENWGDLLTAYNGATISYDEIGNPDGYSDRTFTWERGRQLASQTKSGVEWTYTYDANGMRTKRSSDSKTYEYVYSGDKLVQMTITDHTTSPETVQFMEFSYDAAGQPLAMALDGVLYYYVLNIQGDVMGMVDSSGNLAISYNYEGYGAGYYVYDTSDMTDTLLSTNPLLYRSYVLDTGTGLYYLQSRYYDPALGRFINADAFVSTGQGVLGNNMFGYCLNNPVNMADSSGNAPIFPQCIPTIIPKLIKDVLDLIKDNKKHNSEADRNRGTTTENEIINDQNGTTGEAFVYGNYNASWNTCEVIALHNVFVLCGLDSSLSETIVLAQCAGIMIGDGFFGSNPYALGQVLSLRGLEYTRVGVDGMTNPGVYIISFWNEGAPWNGLHTVAVSYDGIAYTAYNLYGNGYEYPINPASYADSFICGYYIGG